MNVIGNGTIALLRNQGELARLRADPELIGSAIEELLRYDGPVVGIPRLTTEDAEIAGQVIPAGAVALGMVGAANRDPQAFDDPDRLDIGPREGRHVAFSYGRHLCPGAGGPDRGQQPGDPVPRTGTRHGRPGLDQQLRCPRGHQPAGADLTDAR